MIMMKLILAICVTFVLCIPKSHSKASAIKIFINYSASEIR
jgi:hypothetical protein